MKFGVNYVPPRQWFYSWQDVNLDYVKEDFAAISLLGADHIRLHLRWDLFQPNPVYVPEVLLEKLRQMLVIAEQNGLEVYVSVFTGWMSGFWFLPNFALDKHIITNETMLRAEEFFLKTLSECLMPCGAFRGIDLGNELNVYGMEHPFSVEEGDFWLHHITDYAKGLFPGKELVLGVDHQPWFEDRYFSRSALSQTGTMTSLHTWVQFCGATAFGTESAEVLSLQEYSIELANAYSETPDRKIWLQEFGVVRAWMREEQFRDFVFQSMMNAARSDHLWGYTWWCSHEFSKSFQLLDPSESEFGLLTERNQLKPLGQYFRDCVSDIKKGICAPPLKKGSAIVIDENKPFVGWEYGRRYAQLILDGVHAKFVLSSKKGDQNYLKSRGISELLLP